MVPWRPQRKHRYSTVTSSVLIILIRSLFSDSGAPIPEASTSSDAPARTPGTHWSRPESERTRLLAEKEASTTEGRNVERTKIGGVSFGEPGIWVGVGMEGQSRRRPCSTLRTVKMSYARSTGIVPSTGFGGPTTACGRNRKGYFPPVLRRLHGNPLPPRGGFQHRSSQSITSSRAERVGDSPQIQWMPGSLRNQLNCRLAK